MKDRTEQPLKRGDWIRILAAPEILKTLDPEGCVEGLPFMPEMLSYCGQRRQVAQRVFRVCLDIHPFCIRKFSGGELLILEDLRCSGDYHYRCARGCILFWKPCWLERCEFSTPLAPTNPYRHSELARDAARLKVRESAEVYFCQSTRLPSITTAQTSRQKLFSGLVDCRAGNRSLLGAVRVSLRPLTMKLLRRLGWEKAPCGVLSRTPTECLDLQPGEWVQVKSRKQILQTLDRWGRNRGLSFDWTQFRHCGKRFQVRRRIGSIILEENGRMRKLDSTVVLEGADCTCPCVVGGCFRRDEPYWREIWLRRALADPDGRH